MTEGSRPTPTQDSTTTPTRRAMLAAMATGGAASIAGCGLFSPDEDASTQELEGDRARELAERYAPTIYFDEHERWFPTDPRQFESEQDGTTVVDGFDALDGYVPAGGDEDPPAPTGFYHVVQYEDSPLAVVQLWFYSAFDQFTTNFHWHDWELLQVFVDTDTEEPQLYVASSHSRKVPNNEFQDPESDGHPRILTELGSHSSGLSVNDDEQHFQRLSIGGEVADITNSLVEGIENIADLPLAYGLPRDEGLVLPYAVPELDGKPLYDHDGLPNVSASDLVPDELTVRSFAELGSPPEDLPERSTGYRFEFEGRAVDDADYEYALAPTSDVEHIADFTGPQLSFEFQIPKFAEDLVADHITTTGVPWDDPRYTDPARDITDAKHRQALADSYDAIGEPSEVDQVIAAVTNAISDPDAPEDEGLTTEEPSTELFALLQSEPDAVPTFRGIAAVQDVPPGEHTLTVNGAGVAPYSEPVTVGEDGDATDTSDGEDGDATDTSDGDGGDDAGVEGVRTTVAGVSGEIPVVARENAAKLEVDADGTDRELTGVTVADDFAGAMYDAELDGPDAVYVHQGGAFTTEVRDADDEVGAFRVNPDRSTAKVRIDEPKTGKEPLADYLGDVAEETADSVRAVDDDDDDDDGADGGGQQNAIQGLAQALDAVASAARKAADNADRGNASNADQNLEVVRDRLGRVAERLQEASDDLPDDIERATAKRLEESRKRNEQALEADKL